MISSLEKKLCQIPIFRKYNEANLKVENQKKSITQLHGAIQKLKMEKQNLETQLSEKNSPKTPNVTENMWSLEYERWVIFFAVLNQIFFYNSKTMKRWKMPYKCKNTSTVFSISLACKTHFRLTVEVQDYRRLQDKFSNAP